MLAKSTHYLGTYVSILWTPSHKGAALKPIRVLYMGCLDPIILLHYYSSPLPPMLCQGTGLGAWILELTLFYRNPL